MARNRTRISGRRLPLELDPTRAWTPRGLCGLAAGGVGRLRVFRFSLHSDHDQIGLAQVISEHGDFFQGQLGLGARTGVMSRGTRVEREDSRQVRLEELEKGEWRREHGRNAAHRGRDRRLGREGNTLRGRGSGGRILTATSLDGTSRSPIVPGRGRWQIALRRRRDAAKCGRGRGRWRHCGLLKEGGLGDRRGGADSGGKHGPPPSGRAELWERVSRWQLVRSRPVF
jgi:hypothetical protein